MLSTLRVNIQRYTSVEGQHKLTPDALFYSPKKSRVGS